MTVDTQKFKRGMRSLAGGVTIVTAMGANGPAGLTATAVSSLSDTPPSILCSVNNKLAAHQAIKDAGAFCIHVLEASQRDVANRFAGKAGVLGSEKFAAYSWQTLGTGAPVLADCLAAFDCRLGPYLELATHTIFTGTIEAVVAAEEGRPLIYSNGNFATLGPDSAGSSQTKPGISGTTAATA